MASGFDIMNTVTFPNKTFQRVQVGRIDPKAPAGREFILDGSAIVWNHKFQQVCGACDLIDMWFLGSLKTKPVYSC